MTQYVLFVNIDTFEKPFFLQILTPCLAHSNYLMEMTNLYNTLHGSVGLYKKTQQATAVVMDSLFFKKNTVGVM